MPAGMGYGEAGRGSDLQWRLACSPRVLTAEWKRRPDAFRRFERRSVTRPRP
jgi:hypothetical protein